MLTPTELAKAVRLNPIWQGKLKGDWPLPAVLRGVGITEFDPRGPDFALQVDAFQDQHQLLSDGIVGPTTAREILRAHLAVNSPGAVAPPAWEPPPGSDSFIVNGLRIPVTNARILDWHETNLTFGNGHGVVARRTSPVVMGHFHSTGGEGNYRQVWNTLVDRNLSVDALLDADVFVQYTDPAKVYTMHGGWANGISWGWEITNDIDPSRGSRRRPLITGTLLGQTHTWDGLLPIQAEMLPELAKAWCDAFGIPYLIPGRNGRPLDGPVVERSLVMEYRRLKHANRIRESKQLANEAVDAMREAYTGTCVGHFMTSLSGKPDPSPDVFDVLLQSGFNIKEV